MREVSTKSMRMTPFLCIITLPSKGTLIEPLPLSRMQDPDERIHARVVRCKDSIFALQSTAHVPRMRETSGEEVTRQKRIALSIRSFQPIEQRRKR